MTALTRVSVDAPHIKQQMKVQRLTPQIVMAMAGYKEIGSTNFNRYMREGSLPLHIANTLTKFGISLC